jgi:hypothetical protein
VSAVKKLRRRLAETDRIVESYSEVAGPVFAREFTPDCCLNATWIALHVFRQLGLTARPMSVRALACNRSYLMALESNFKEHHPFAWSVMLDVEEASDMPGWPGHVVAIVEGRLLVDSSAGQMSRPMKGIVVPQIVVAPWKDGRELQLQLPEGALLAYDERKADKSYLDMPGFRGHAENREVAREILDRIR